MPADGAARTVRRPGRLALVGGIGLSLGLAGIAAAWARPPALDDRTVAIEIHYSHFSPSAVTVPLGVPIRFVIVNTDPIDHEWIVGDAAVHERHRTGTEPVHGARPTEVSVPAGRTVTTVVTFDVPGSQPYICHLPATRRTGWSAP